MAALMLTLANDILPLMLLTLPTIATGVPAKSE
jgi:hypothetical protein